ncbi:MAG TPA: cytochrome P450, partial [Burkholderiaceae bacterium]|nr:cytochrome P450 [Burkholderiaceae bacterium]
SGVDKLRYTEAVATEAMRLKPVGPLQALQALCDLRIGELHLPAGTIIVSPVRDGALREQLFPQAHKFLPERWLNGDAKAIDDTRRAIFPFGGGPRYCPGRYLAMVEIKLVVSMLFRNFAPRLTADPATIGEHYHLTMGPDTLPMALEQRSPA